MPNSADIIVTLFCIPPPKHLVMRPFGRTGRPYSAKFISEPGYRISHSSCEDSATNAEKMKHHTFLMSFLPGADIFLPPWQLHVPLHFDKLFFASYVKWLSWDEKRLKGNRLGMYLANNCQQIDRYHWIQTLIHEDVVDSFGTCQNNINYNEKKSSIFLPIKTNDWKDYNWRSFLEMHWTKIFVMSEYLFYLAFENSRVDPIWLTEKYIASWMSGSLPVFMGPANWEKRFLPAPHSAIFVDDFESPKHLAVYMKYLASNRSAYELYFAWHQLPVHELSAGFLSLWESERRYTYLTRLSNLASYGETAHGAHILDNPRIFQEGKGFVTQREHQN